MCNFHKLLYRFDALPLKNKNSAAGGIRSLDQNVPSGMRTHELYHSAIRAVCSGGILRHINMNLIDNLAIITTIRHYKSFIYPVFQHEQLLVPSLCKCYYISDTGENVFICVNTRQFFIVICVFLHGLLT